MSLNFDTSYKSKANCEGYNNNRLLHASYAKDVIDDIKTKNMELNGEDIFRFIAILLDPVIVKLFVSKLIHRISGKGRPGRRRYVDFYDNTDVLTFPGEPYSSSTELPHDYMVGPMLSFHKFTLGINVTACDIKGNLKFDTNFYSICQSDKEEL